MVLAINPAAVADLSVTTETHCLFLLLPIPNSPYPQKAPLAVLGWLQCTFQTEVA